MNIDTKRIEKILKHFSKPYGSEEMLRGFLNDKIRAREDSIRSEAEYLCSLGLCKIGESTEVYGLSYIELYFSQELKEFIIEYNNILQLL